MNEDAAMTITFNRRRIGANALPTPTANAPVASETPAKRKGKGGHAKPLKVLIDLSQPGRLRVGHLLALLSISHATLYAKLKAGSGDIPPPDGYDGRRPYWKTSTVREFLET